MDIRRHFGQENSRDAEAGYMLVAVVVAVALVLLALSVAAPVIARDLRRDKEVESEHRAEQYVRAIRMYYRKTKSYPPSMEALEKTNNVRFLRQKYVDPLTGKSDWRIIHNPQTKTHIPFGQELSGMAAGLGAAAGMQSSGVGGAAGTSGSTVTSTNALNSGFGGSTIGGSSGAAGSTGASGSTGSGMFGDSSGGIIYGVGPNRTGDSILNPNQQETYETWEFWYDPLIELLYAKGNFTGGGGIGSQSASSFGSDATNGLNGATGSTGASGNTGAFGGTFGNGPQTGNGFGTH